MFAAIIHSIIVSTVGERLEPDVALLVVLLTVDDIALVIHKLELELVRLQFTSGQILLGRQFDQHVFRLVRVLEEDALFAGFAVGVGDAGGELVALRVLGDGDGDGVAGCVVGDATQGSVLFVNRVRVHAGLVERELVEFEGSVSFADVLLLIGFGLRVAWNADELFCLEQVAVGILQFGGELVVVQVTSGQMFGRFESHADGCWRVRVVESDVIGLTVGGCREHAVLVGDGDGHVIGLGGVADGLVRSGEFLHVVRVYAGHGVDHLSEGETASLVGHGLRSVLASGWHWHVVHADGVAVRIMCGYRVQLELEFTVLRNAAGCRIRVDDVFHAADRVSDVLRTVMVGERDVLAVRAGGRGDGLGYDGQLARMVNILDHVGDGRDRPVLRDARNGRILLRHGEHVGADERERQLVESDVALLVVPFRLVGVRHVGGRGLLLERECEVFALERVLVALGGGHLLHCGRIVRGGLGMVRVGEFRNVGSVIILHVGQQLAFAIVGDGDFHMMFRSIIGDAALVAVDFAERVVVHSRLLVGDGVEQDVALLVVGFHRSGLAACLVLDAFELVLSGLQLDACMVGVVEGLVRTELHADRLRLIRVRERGRIGRVRSGLGFQLSGQIVGDGDLPHSHVGIVVDAARRLADFTHRIGERLGLVAFQLAGGERQRLEADGTVLGGVDGLHGHADRPLVVEQLELEVGELRVTVVGVAERLVGGEAHGHVLRLIRVVEDRGLARIVVGGGGFQLSVPVIGDRHVHHMHGLVVGDARQFA